MAFTQSQAKGFMVGSVLALVTLIFIGRLLPYVWGFLTNGNATVDNETFTVSDVPGGDLLTGLIVFLMVLVIGIALVLKIFDLI